MLKQDKKIKAFKKDIIIPKPSTIHVKYYLDLWDSLENYRLQEAALKKLFNETYPKNLNIEDILIKVVALNDFYSTHIFSPFKMAKHILTLKTDDRLASGDLTLVNDIALLKVNDNKNINMYSFATKYCSHHKPDIYAINDYYVEEVLKYFRSKNNFSTFSNSDLKKYENFKRIIKDFQSFYNLECYTVKDFDRYLWQLGKDHFKRNYK